MRIKNAFLKIWSFYYTGFREMTLGKVLWVIILVKLFIMFFVLRLFFFPDFVATHSGDGEEAHFVGNELIERMAP